MTVNTQDINDYLDWKMQQNLSGVRDSVQDFAQYRERLDLEQRVENASARLVELIAETGFESDYALQKDLMDAYQLITGVEYRPDDV